MSFDVNELIKNAPVVADIRDAKETEWENPKKLPFEEAKKTLPLTDTDIDDAEARLARFAPFIMKAYPETQATNGLIESPLTDIPEMKELLNKEYGAELTGKLLLKQDSHLAIAGSVKARGGIYEVLKHSEELAIENGMLKPGDSYELFATPEFKKFFSQFAIHVGSTGNLGLSIGIMSAVIGYQVNVHMSMDAKQWKKDLLRSKGVNVIEYASDYSQAVANGRKLAESDPKAYFVDDENSTALFLGYAVAARRLKKQLAEKSITVDADHPMICYIPCGVGGAPGGITFGLKSVFGDNVYVFYEEPVQAPCMLLGMCTGLHDAISVQDVGLTGLTAADGLAVGRPSKFVGKTVEHILDGEFTVDDFRLFDYMRGLLATEKIFIEPSSCASFQGPANIHKLADFYKKNGFTEERLANTTHIAWATGGRLVPENEKEIYINTHLDK